MRLARLTGLERDKIIAEYKEVMLLIADLKDILEKPERVTDMIRTEIKVLIETHGDERRTEIVASAADEFTMESLVSDDEVAVTISHTGYVKRTPIDDIRAQRRGGKGKAGMLTRDEDVVASLFISSNHQTLLCFSNMGHVFEVKVYELPELPLRSRGKHFASLVKLSEGERIVSVLPIKEFKEGFFIVCCTQFGYVKKTDLMAYSNVRASGIIALKLDEGDSLVSCAITSGQNEILIATRWGKAIRFNEDEIRPMGRASRGVTGIRFGDTRGGRRRRTPATAEVPDDGAPAAACRTSRTASSAWKSSAATRPSSRSAKAATASARRSTNTGCNRAAVRASTRSKSPSATAWSSASCR